MRSREHLVADYPPLATRWVIWDNARIPAKQLASSESSDINAVVELLK
ncbi:putative ABC-type ATPase [Ereboglobus sp. PH5-10]|nr:putative ABC-type ATPase [Ereboglobus sp. PH5-10]